MTNVKEHFVGIDVSKDRLDVAGWGEKRVMEAANTNLVILVSPKCISCACDRWILKKMTSSR